MNGNPFLFQALFVPDHFIYKYQSQEWTELKQMNFYFINKKAISSHAAFAKRQLQQGEGKIKRAYQKNYYHSLRLCYESERLMQGLTPRIWFEKDSPEWTKMMEIRTHLPSEEKRSEIFQFIMEKLRNIEKSKPWINLPDLHEIKMQGSGDYFVYHLNRWLITVRSTYLGPVLL